MRALVDSPIVKVISGKMMIHLEDIEGIFREGNTASFEATLYWSSGDDDGLISRYAVTVNNARQFTLVAQYLGEDRLFDKYVACLQRRRKCLGSGGSAPARKGLSASMLDVSVQ